MKSRTKPDPKWKRRPEARPDEILSAALEVFGEQGFERAKLDDVARKAGVSKGTLYLYFDSKDALFREMVRVRLTPIFSEAEQAVREFKGSSRDLLTWFIRNMWESINRPEMVRLAGIVQAELANFPELAQFYLETVILRKRALMKHVLERGVASGEFRQVAHDFTLRAVSSLLVHGAMYQTKFSVYDPQPLTSEQLLEGVIDLVFNGVLIRPDDHPGLKE